jgi:ubiquinone/menaquinone biosynthesis C-methylase UbiE
MISAGPYQEPPGAGKSSFDLIEAEKFFRELNLMPGVTFLDLGCGQGAYTLPAAEIIGPSGRVYAVDLWAAGLAALREAAHREKVKNLQTLVADSSQPLPLASGSIDVCLLATVLHDLAEAGTAAGTLREAARLLKTGGKLAIVEFNKKAGPPGPPVDIKMSPPEVEAMVAPYGFRQDKLVEVGPHNYLLIFRREAIPGAAAA